MNFLQGALNLFLEYKEMYITGILTTLLVAITGTVFGLIIGMVLAFFRDLKNHDGEVVVIRILKRFFKALANIYVELVRGTPMVVQAVFLYYGLYQVLNWTPITASIIIVSLNTAAYMSEIIRSGISSVDRGQREAGLSLGLSNFQVYRYIVLPQAIKNSFPSIGNEFVVNIKDSSVLNAIALTELFFQGMSVAGTNYDFSSSMFIIGLIYFVLTYIVTRILAIIEKKLNLPESTIKSISVAHT